MSQPLAYLNGQFIPASHAAIPLTDGGFVQGVTVSEQVRTFRGRLFRLAEHLKRLEQSRSQLSYTRLRAPAAGSIASVPAEVNENVQSGDEIALLTAGLRPQVIVAVPEGLIGDIERGDVVRVTFDALPGRDFAAVVTQVGVAATELTTTFPVLEKRRAP